MLFNSYSFFVFFPIVVVVYFLLPKRVSYLWLLTASYYFYMGWNAKYALLLLLSTAITYISGIVIQWLNDNRPEKIEAKKWVVVGCIVANLAILFFFKYFNFTIESINAVLDHTSLPTVNTSLDVLLPVGISFYTFQALSYIIDVYRGEVKPQKKLMYFALYISMFPQLIAGPIVRYVDIEEQLEHRSMNVTKFGQGAMYFMRGLAKKVILANTTGAVFEQIAAMHLGSYSVMTAWIGCILMHSRFILISAATAIWRSDLDGCSDFISRRISTILTVRPASGNSGEDGIFPCPAGFWNISIFRLAATEKAKCVPASINLSYFYVPVSGMEPT